MEADQFATEQLFPTATQLAGWRVETCDGVVSVYGPCPHCRHDCWTELRERVLLGGASASLADANAPLEAVPRRLMCNCERVHPDKPNGVLAGCGRFWMCMVLQWPDKSWIVQPLTDVTLFSALTALAQDEQTQDARLRDAAEKWIGGITALCGLFALAGFATAKDALAGVGTPGRLVVALVYIAALVCAAIALLTGYTAAYGWPVERETLTAEQVRAWYRERREGADTAAKRLRTAVILACTTLGLLSMVALMLWFLPRTAPVVTPAIPRPVTPAVP